MIRFPYIIPPAFQIFYKNFLLVCPVAPPAKYVSINHNIANIFFRQFSIFEIIHALNSV